ncbi:GYD domain protein [compost metagenome]
MATFLSAIEFTAQGIAGCVRRAADLRGAGRQAATALMLQLSALGNVHTTTSRAFIAAEMDKVLGKMSG